MDLDLILGRLAEPFISKSKIEVLSDEMDYIIIRESQRSVHLGEIADPRHGGGGIIVVPGPTCDGNLTNIPGS